MPGAPAVLALLLAALLSGADGPSAVHPTPFAPAKVAADTGRPPLTLLYQNFPNPFPSATSINTCIWFDLAQAGPVQLEVYDLRGHVVKMLLAVRRLEAGEYGRAPGGGCEAQYAWDGTSADGRIVDPGVYLIRLRAGDRDLVVKALFLGR